MALGKAESGRTAMGKIGVKPLERALLEDVEDALRQHGVVFCLDKHGYYAALADPMAKASASGEFGYPVAPFRGRHL